MNPSTDCFSFLFIKEAVLIKKDITQTTMQFVFNQMKTPYKQGMILREEGCYLDCPSVFRDDAASCWCLVFARYHPLAGDQAGYETWMATSDDLLNWQVKGRILSQGSGGWDDRQVNGAVALIDPEWNGTHNPSLFNGLYWMSYLGGEKPGYEPDPLSIGMACSDYLLPAHEWDRPLSHPVLSPNDQDARPFERQTLYKSTIIRDPENRLGAPFLMFYNGKQKEYSIERIGLAISDDLLHWHRYGKSYLVETGIQDRWSIAGDPQLIHFEDFWVMHYFKAHDGTAYDTFALSDDLLNWTPWDGEPLVAPTEPYDRIFAHKPFVLKHEGIVYHFYCAVGDQGRGIALSTSEPIRNHLTD